MDIDALDVSRLLGRQSVKAASPGAVQYLMGSVVLITGAGGSIGSELALQVAAQRPKKLLLLGHGENSIFSIDMIVRERFPELAVESIIADIQDRNQMNEVFRLHQPELVFHAAAHKHVPLMEKNPLAAILNNVWGTRNVAEISMQYGVKKFIFISTDKAVYPANVMGATKRVSEMIIQQLSENSQTQFAVVRFGNVLESRGSVIPIFKKQLAEGGPLTVSHPDMVRYFMSIPEAVHLVLQAGALSKGGEIFILDMGEPVNVLELAKALIRLAGLEPERDIPITFIGIRPGEKVKESLTYDEEIVSPSSHPNISVIIPKPLNTERLLQDLEQLENLLPRQSDAVMAVLERIIANGQQDSPLGMIGSE
ncbi:UDP-N-acetylglucosamine 4,6-dehydratase family protein [Paenibacillus soyae]|uniref:Polysaccharide biosynthesis protein n=1 Tax=Paenibacillus soyae TaxID=2969249 RepID=A0A9X2SAD2_9BACL|nr:polysaccharide biosynthesis protein [Paenibacillus soyae]